MNELDEKKIIIILDHNKENEDLIKSLLNNKKIDITIQDNYLDRKIINILTKLGMPSNIQGHRYLKEALKLSIINSIYYLHPFSELYPILSKKFNVKNYIIEKSIRDAISITWDRGNFDYQNELFGYTINREKGKPTNSEFLALISNYLNTN